MVNDPDKIEAFVAKIEPEKQALIQLLRKNVHAISDRSATEAIKWNALCFFKGERAFVGVMPYTNYISVIFDRGSELADETGILEGGGKQMRHIKIRLPEDIRQKKVARYIRDSFLLPD